MAILFHHQFLVKTNCNLLMQGQMLIVILIFLSLIILPSLLSSVIETMNLQKSGRGTFNQGNSPFVIIIGLFDNANRVIDVLNVFLHKVSIF